MRRALGFAFVMALAGITGCKAKPPGRMETRVITLAKHRVFIGGRSQVNPLKFTSDNVADGKEAFGHYCAACHGIDGQNTGVPFAKRMSPPVPSLAGEDVQQYTDGQLKWIIDNGIWPSGMPGSSGTLSDDEIWSTVLYIRHLPAAGSQGVPEMYQH